MELAAGDGSGAGDLFSAADDDVGEGEIDDGLLVVVPGDGVGGVAADAGWGEAGGRVQVDTEAFRKLF